MKNFGFCGYDNVIYIGTNGKMNEICAAMGLTSLESLEQFIAVNYRNYQAYRQELQAIRGVRLLEYDEGERNNYHYIVLEIDESEAGVSAIGSCTFYTPRMSLLVVTFISDVTGWSHISGIFRMLTFYYRIPCRSLRESSL
jgi:DegT/DnrJ/EryC1/StrS aminotransferase family protein